MSGTQLTRYHRALVHYLRRCSHNDPPNQDMRARLAGVPTEDQTRRQAGHASPVTLTVPRARL